ncbi:hypothetical protein ACLF3G_03510 [Falsiroseomonas sp. HC035]|uniref:hypothetical protein n=1 Tax=Falsiroseomonas sp. HC035 TaxID=3390999 RepID=UPI003D316E1B
MMLRMAAGTMMGGMLLAGAVTTLAIGAGAVGTVLLARRICEERRGWRRDAAIEPDPLPDAMPDMDTGLADAT